MTTSVLIPTWRRPDELAKCLSALIRQTLKPEQVVVTIRRDDVATLEKIEHLRIRCELPNGFEAVILDPSPLTAAMSAGLSRTTGDLVALTDDDAEPRPDWLARCNRYFLDDKVGGVGGRDWQPGERWNAKSVGRLSWFGRVSGNHHLGAGAAREVELLKGVNCCFRGDLLRKIGFDRRLHGSSNVTHWEMALCFTIRRHGWRLIYDPSIAVDHNCAPRHDNDLNSRGRFDRQSYIDAIHNEVVATTESLSGMGRLIYPYWLQFVGTKGSPGVIQALRRWLLLREPWVLAWGRYTAGREGVTAARSTLGNSILPANNEKRYELKSLCSKS